MSLRRVFIYLLRPRWHRKSFRTATRYPAPTTPEQPDFAHGKFLVFCNLQPTKSACSAATENVLSGVGQPLSSVSGRKRYKTLDFASKIVCQVELRPPLDTPAKGNAVSLWIPYANRDATRPYWITQSQKRALPSFGNLPHFLRLWYPNCKNAVRIPLLENEKPLQFLSCAGMKIVAALLFCRTNISAGRH